MLNCNGKVNFNDWRINRSNSFIQNELENVIFSSQDSPCFLGDIMLFGSVLPSATAALNLKHLSTCMEMKLKLLSRRRTNDFLSNKKSARNQPDLYSARKDIYECIVYVRSYLNSIKWDTELIKNVEGLLGEDLDDLILGLNKFLQRLKAVNDSVFHYAASNRGNESLQPDFHLYHLHLELRWLYLTLVHAKECPESYATQIANTQDTLFSLGDVEFSDQTAGLDAAMAGVVDDLIYIAMKLFERIPLTDLRTKSPYSCTCARELWLMLQIFIDDLAAKRKSKTFWQYVNNSLDTRIEATRSEVSTSWTNRVENNSINCKNPEMFCLWLIYHLALLYGYNMDIAYAGVSSARIQPNYTQVEKILKVYVNRGGKAGERDEIDEELRGMIPLLTILTCEWWQPRVQIVSLLWDCFHRRLDQPFLLQATGPWLASVDKKGAADILKQVKQRIEDNLEQNKLSSYGMFLRLLGVFLRKSTAANDSKYWNQIKGRVYSKFTKSKVEEFSEAGLYNFISLFVTLALTTNTSEVCDMMLDLLPTILDDTKDHKSRIVVWKGELVVLLLFAEQKINFEKVSRRLLNEIDKLSCRKDETSRSMLAAYVDVLNEVLTSSDNMELSEHFFIGGWIEKYILECSKTKVNLLITILNNVFEKCIRLKSSNTGINSGGNGSSQTLEALWRNVAGTVRLLVLHPEIYGDHYQSLIELAVKFTLQALRDPGMADRHKQEFSSLFRHFSSTLKIPDVRITRSYLALILKNENAADELRKKLKNFNVIVIQAWIKCCVLEYGDLNKDTKYLTLYITSSDEITKTFSSQSDLIEMQNNETPIILFIKVIMKQWQNLQTQQERLVLGAKCREYFARIERWAAVPITEQTKDYELTHWIYRCIGKLISYCSPMLYVKNQTTTMLIVLINKFMLPSDETAYIVHIGRRIFHLIISGIGNLDVKGDIRLQLLIYNLFDKYLPYLITDLSNQNWKVSESLLLCFRGININYLKLIFEKLAVNFITVGRDFTTHKNCYLVIILLKNLVNRGKSLSPHITDMIISICLPHIITCYMKVHNLHPHRQQTIDIIRNLIRSPYYTEDPTRRKEMMLTFTNMVQKYLTTASEKLFEFMTSVCEIIPELRPRVCSDIEKLLDNNKYPNSAGLRFSLNKLKKS